MQYSLQYLTIFHLTFLKDVNLHKTFVVFHTWALIQLELNISKKKRRTYNFRDKKKKKKKKNSGSYFQQDPVSP